MTIWQGSHYSIVFNLRNHAAEMVIVYPTAVMDYPPIDITGWTFRSQIRDKNSDKEPMIELTTENGGIVVLDAINGKFELVITAEQNEAFSLGNVVGDLFRMDIVPGPERLFGFRDRVRRPVTRNE